MNLSNRIKMTRVMNAVAAGTSEQTSSAINMAGFDGCIFRVLFGTITSGAATSIKVTQCDTTGGTYADLEGTSVTIADTDDNKGATIEIYRPREQFLKLVISRATQNAVIDGVIAEQYGAIDLPTTDDSTTCVTREIHISPAEGTA